MFNLGLDLEKLRKKAKVEGCLNLPTLAFIGLRVANPGQVLFKNKGEVVA
jgi:hypothetical protein